MFFKRYAIASSSARPSRHLRLAIGAFAALAMLPGLAPRLAAQELPAVLLLQDQPMGNADKLKLGVEQYRKGQYEESLATLQQVDGSKLAPGDQKTLSDTLAKAEAAANERKAARAEFEKGEESLNLGNPVEAIAHYRSAARNPYADEGTKAKAREQMALAEAQMKQSGQSFKDMYAQAVADYKAGNYAEARAKFEALDAARFRAPMFQRSPADYLRDIDRRLANAPPEPPVAPPETMPPPAETAQQPPPTEVPPSPAPSPTETTVEQPPPAMPQPPPTPEPTIPAPVVIERDTQPVPQIADTTPAPVPPEEAPPETVTREEAKEAYRLGRQQYREGDLAAARRSFLIAERGGYRAGLFEDSPSKYLARIDRQEQAQAARAAQRGEAAGTTEADELRSTAQAERLRVEQNRFEAQQLVDQAQTAREAGRTEDALALFARAADLDPNNDRAQAGKAEMARVTGRQPAPRDALDRQALQVQQTRQYVDFSIRNALEQANRARAARQWSEAYAAITRAQVARDTNPGVFTQPELASYDSSIANTRNAIAREEEQARIAEATAAQVETAQRLTAAERAAAEERARTVRDRIREARRLVQEGKYREALGVIDQILILDPNNDYAIGARPLVEDRALFADQRRAREDFDRNLTRVLNIAEEQRVPYSDVLIYPSNWPDITEIRRSSVAAERGELAEDQAVTSILEKKLPEVRLDGSAFSDVVDFLRDISGANIFVNWKALEGVGIDRGTQVTARLRDVKFSKVLRTVLSEVGGGAVKLGYTIDEGVITISTEEDLANNVSTRVYDIRDLIINVPDFDNAPDFSLQGSSAGGGGGQSNLFGGNVNNQQQQGALTRNELVDAIIKLIQDTVASDSWKDNGGSIGSIRELAGQLIVTQTPENQRALVRLLEQLRETRAIQVTVEARFLVVQRNFLEDIGVDFDFSFNNSDPGDRNRKFSPITVSQNSFEFNSDLSSLDTTIPGNLGLEYTAKQLAPNLTTGFTFLDDFQVSLLLRATQAAQTSSTLTAPRVTLFNGQRAFVLVATETAYVSDLTPIVGTNAVAFDPQPGVVQSGVLLDVVATVSSDRKYVTLTLRPTLSRLRALVQFPVTALTAGGGQDGGVPISQTAFLQQPVRDITTVRTTVSVPDGGTLMIGGQTLNGEIEREAGVPVLSKIPFLKRLFTNRSMSKDDQILLILIRPTIIIQREREAEQFPLLNTK